MPQPELDSPTPAKQAQGRALGHVAALNELATEFPADSRSPEDNAYMKKLYQEGHELRNEASDLHQAQEPLHQDLRTGRIMTTRERADYVASGENRPASGPTG